MVKYAKGTVAVMQLTLRYLPTEPPSQAVYHSGQQYPAKIWGRDVLRNVCYAQLGSCVIRTVVAN